MSRENFDNAGYTNLTEMGHMNGMMSKLYKNGQASYDYHTETKDNFKTSIEDD